MINAVNRVTEIQVLDLGYVRFVESWGVGDAGLSEAGIIEAARQSTQGAFRGWDKDLKLLRFLYEHQHSTPFEFAGMVIEVQAPLMIFREWHRHRTQSYNEMSARYAPMPDNHYLPTPERALMINEANRQANALKGVEPITVAGARQWIRGLQQHYTREQQLYEQGLHIGMPKELARLPVSVGRYSRMRASTNLRNWLAFLTLRMAPDAQWEIQQYANAVGTFIEGAFPRTWEVFNEKR